MTSKDWARDLTHRVASEIKTRRGEHTVQWLSDRTADFGHRISRSRISDLERGDRGGLLGVAELLVLAAALEVPPVILLFPGLPAGPVELVPGETVESWDALRWFTGESGRAGNVQTAAGATVLLDDLRELEDADRRHRSAVSNYERRAAHAAELEAAGEGAKAAQVGAFLQAIGSNIVGAADRCNSLLKRLRERGVPLSDADRWQERASLTFESDDAR